MNQKIVDELKENGFVKNSENILTSDELHELKNCINKLFSDKSIDINTGSNALVIDSLAGIDPSLDFLLTKLITHENVRFVLNYVLGDNYKISQITVRRSIPGDTGLDLHQDAPGETGMILLLTDNLRSDGATSFLSKSHQLPRWSRKISWSSVTISSPFLSPLKGKIGDIGFFFNRTWHARLKNMSKKTHDVLLISFFPHSAIYESTYDEERLKMLNQPELRKLLDPNDGSIQINIKEDEDNNIPYVMKLESPKYLNGPYKVKLLVLKVLSLQVVFSPIRWLYRLLNSLKI